ncbi:hypothetical protein GGS21DRAFT_307013 [Xylaria nigripes]|nr:hypothetical protein GGS21DRAFT_307013 [Xylaria nigripes]
MDQSQTLAFMLILTLHCSAMKPQGSSLQACLTMDKQSMESCLASRKGLLSPGLKYEKSSCGPATGRLMKPLEEISNSNIIMEEERQVKKA